jgi:hypothetical protein
MRKPQTVKSLEELGRIRLSKSFFMREFLYSEISQIEGIPNIPDDPDLAIEAGRNLCEKVLEPIQDALGRISVRSAFRARDVNAKGAENQNQKTFCFIKGSESEAETTLHCLPQLSSFQIEVPQPRRREHQVIIEIRHTIPVKCRCCVVALHASMGMFTDHPLTAEFLVFLFLLLAQLFAFGLFMGQMDVDKLGLQALES